MLNQVILVGRIVKDLEVKKLEDGKKVTTMTLAIPRSFKNEQGEYETDFIDCRLYNSIAENTAEYCRKGDIVGVKGRIQTTQNIDENGNITDKTTNIMAEKVTFLSSRKEND